MNENAIEVLLAKQGLKLIEPGHGRPRESQLSLKLRLALINLRLFTAKARYVLACALCRILGNPYQPNGVKKLTVAEHAKLDDLALSWLARRNREAHPLACESGLPPICLDHQQRQP